MIDFIQQTGWFFYPLALCSVVAVLITVERLLALRTGAVLPRSLEPNFGTGEPPQGDEETTAGRILAYHAAHRPDPEQLRAYARYEVGKLERGLFILDVVVSAAPLLGLMGTVAGLVGVFGTIQAGAAAPDSDRLAAGIALALNTTLLGLAIAIPALAASALLYRRVDTLSARLEVRVQQLLARRETAGS